MLSCLALSCLVSSRLVLFFLVSSWLASSRRVASRLFSSLVSSRRCLLSSLSCVCLVLSRLSSRHVVISYRRCLPIASRTNLSMPPVVVWFLAKGNVVAHWLGDSPIFASSSVDGHVFLWDTVSRSVVKDIRFPANALGNVPVINDMAVTKDGAQILVLLNEKEVRLYDVEESKHQHVVLEDHCMTSICMCADGRSLLANVKGKDIVQWDVCSKQRSRIFSGALQARYIIRSTFGGTDDDFVASGSEDGHVYVWTRHHRCGERYRTNVSTEERMGLDGMFPSRNHLHSSSKRTTCFHEVDSELSFRPNGNLLLKLPGYDFR